jgi:hypothetical protein
VLSPTAEVAFAFEQLPELDEGQAILQAVGDLLGADDALERRHRHADTVEPRTLAFSNSWSQRASSNLPRRGMPSNTSMSPASVRQAPIPMFAIVLPSNATSSVSIDPSPMLSRAPRSLAPPPDAPDSRPFKPGRDRGPLSASSRHAPTRKTADEHELDAVANQRSEDDRRVERRRLRIAHSSGCEHARVLLRNERDQFLAARRATACRQAQSDSRPRVRAARSR